MNEQDLRYLLELIDRDGDRVLAHRYPTSKEDTHEALSQFLVKFKEVKRFQVAIYPSLDFRSLVE